MAVLDRMSSSNPAFTKGGFATPTPAQLREIYDAPDRLTMDDVVVHTAGLFALLGATAAAGWYLVGGGSAGLPFASGAIAFVLSLVILFRRIASPALILPFTAFEGLFVGGISRVYDARSHGIALQALIGTGAVFGGMLLAYRSGAIRATPKMRRLVFGALAGYVVIGLVDLVVRGVSGSHLPVLNDSSGLGIALSAVIVVVASLQFVLDFDYIERAVAAGAPRKTAWMAGYGLVVSFVWVYLELLRLLSKLRDR